MYLTTDKYHIYIRSMAGNVISVLSVPEEVVSAVLQGDLIVCQTKKSNIIFKRNSPTSNNFSVYRRQAF